MYTNQEKRIASTVKEMAGDLTDCWSEQHEFTWRRPNSDIFSTIDRILYPKNLHKLESFKVNWSLSFSDHAAVEACFKNVASGNPPKTRITRLDPQLAKDPWTKDKVING